jgi:hypothetical protein
MKCSAKLPNKALVSNVETAKHTCDTSLVFTETNLFFDLFSIFLIFSEDIFFCKYNVRQQKRIQNLICEGDWERRG